MASPRVRRLKKLIKLEKYEARMAVKAEKEAAFNHIKQTFDPDIEEFEIIVGDEPENTEGMVEVELLIGDDPAEAKNLPTPKPKKKAPQKKKVITPSKNED